MVNAHVENEGEEGEGNFGTLSELRAWANSMNIPSNAKVVYEGCGTHNIAFEWPKTDDELAAERGNVNLLGQDI